MDYNDKQIGRNIKAIRNANKKDYFEFASSINISDSLLQK
jgi:DNA-binding transcriptional regulator YiaG